MHKLYEINEHEVSINLIVLRRFVIKRRRYIGFFVLISLLAGVFYHLLFNKSYITSVKLYMEIEEQKSSISSTGINVLQSLALGLGQNRVRSDIEQLSNDIINSHSYLICLLDIRIYFSSLDRELTLEEFFNRDVSHEDSVSDKGVWLMFSEIERSGQISRRKFSSSKVRAIQALRKRISIEQLTSEKNRDRLLLTVSLPDPYASFALTEIVLKNLVDYISKRYLFKEQEHLSYISFKFQNAKKKYDSVLYFQEFFEKQNAHTTSPQMYFQKKKIEQDVNFKYRIYSDLGVQYEQVSTMLYQKRPIITILETIGIPIKSISLFLVLLISVAVGVFIGLLSIMTEFAVYLFGYEKYLPYKRREILSEQEDE